MLFGETERILVAHTISLRLTPGGHMKDAL